MRFLSWNDLIVWNNFWTFLRDYALIGFWAEEIISSFFCKEYHFVRVPLVLTLISRPLFVFLGRWKMGSFTFKTQTTSWTAQPGTSKWHRTATARTRTRVTADIVSTFKDVTPTQSTRTLATTIQTFVAPSVTKRSTALRTMCQVSIENTKIKRLAHFDRCRQTSESLGPQTTFKCVFNRFSVNLLLLQKKFPQNDLKQGERGYSDASPKPTNENLSLSFMFEVTLIFGGGELNLEGP